MNSRLPTFLLVVGVPFTLLVLCFGFYNRIEPTILGFPFLYAWMFSCLGISSLSMYIGWRLDPRSDRNLSVKHNSEADKDKNSPQINKGDK
ncbi:MAG: DUF3311 domain-containing protein [Deltaproteobacteria bacterium]|jgi:hypothetical protein|nr:DUF3311 domain-containing protein [Deltaproteobacteria bacterium]